MGAFLTEGAPSGSHLIVLHTREPSRAISARDGFFIPLFDLQFRKQAEVVGEVEALIRLVGADGTAAVGLLRQVAHQDVVDVARRQLVRGLQLFVG